MLSETLRAFFISEFNRNLFSVGTFILLMQQRSTVTKIIFKALNNPNIADHEDDETVKEFISQSCNYIAQRIEIKTLSE